MDRSSRFELFHVPALGVALLLLMNVTMTKPAGAVHVTQPYNFGTDFLAPNFALTNIWGTPRNTLIYSFLHKALLRWELDYRHES
ncbi:unnamed protein product [Allacma fusca]|uniref:Uncharacterized protein n=1 Tax=Allacma fusca TaxID=39272 RepID=A0A8J2PWF4_9HEXA|nr:unnamed protein product [Allacma fusca]